MDNLHAAILSFKLSHLEGLIERRRAIARQYQEGLAEIDKLKLPPPPQEDGRHYDVFQNYEIEAEDRDKLVEHLSDKGIEVALPWGGKAVHQFKALGLSTLSLPRTEEHFRKALMIPMYPSLENAHVRYTIDMITHFYG
jgi:dTDP-4-amino-4,6-dideoxygalactose transaminase